MTEITRAMMITPEMIRKRDVDCGDNSCVNPKARGGMRTNGGCRCHNNIADALEAAWQEIKNHRDVLEQTYQYLLDTSSDDNGMHQAVMKDIEFTLDAK